MRRPAAQPTALKFSGGADDDEDGDGGDGDGGGDGGGDDGKPAAAVVDGAAAAANGGAGDSTAAAAAATAAQAARDGDEVRDDVAHDDLVSQQLQVRPYCGDGDELRERSTEHLRGVCELAQKSIAQLLLLRKEVHVTLTLRDLKVRR